MRVSAIAWWLACFGLGCSASHSADGTGAGGKGTDSAQHGTGSSSGVNGGGANGDVLPMFPGAGSSDASEPLPNGMLCDAVAGQPSPIPKAVRQCFYSADDKLHPAATLEQVLECAQGADTVHLRLTFDPNFVDNTYGANAIGWSSATMTATTAPMMAPMMMAPKMMKAPMGKGGHTFKDLVGSDHAEIQVTDASGKVVLQFKLDYISLDPSRPSGYGSLGVSGGEGKVLVGNGAWVVGWSSSLDRDLNERGYGSYTTDSPATDANYTANSATPEWDYRVVYETWISLDAFGSAGFGGASIAFVHASPSKLATNTVDVMPGDCPPNDCTDGDPDTVCNDQPPDAGTPPDGCADHDPDTPCTTGGGGGGMPPDGCADTDPDTPCTDGGTVSPPPSGGTPEQCTDPNDPNCHVD